VQTTGRIAQHSPQEGWYLNPSVFFVKFRSRSIHYSDSRRLRVFAEVPQSDSFVKFIFEKCLFTPSRPLARSFQLGSNLLGVTFPFFLIHLECGTFSYSIGMYIICRFSSNIRIKEK
jgi:hypothetical protein